MIKGNFATRMTGEKSFTGSYPQVCIDVRADAVGRDRVQEQRVAVGSRLRDLRGGGRAAGPAAIVDDDLLAQRVGQAWPR